MRIDGSNNAINAIGRPGAGVQNANARVVDDFNSVLQKRLSKVLESGNAVGNETAPEKANDRQENFVYQLRRLLDRGLISRQDIIDAAGQPSAQRKEKGGGGSVTSP